MKRLLISIEAHRVAWRTNLVAVLDLGNATGRWLALDAALFDSAAADLVRLAGLRHSIAKLTASVSSDPGEAMKAGTTTLAWSARQ